MVRAAERYESGKRLQGEYTKYEYLKKEVGHIFGTSLTDEAWHGLLKRARQRLVEIGKEGEESKRQRLSKEASRANARKALAEEQGIDEAEIAEDIGGWVMKVVVWLPLMVSAIVKVPNMTPAMRDWRSAHAVLE